MKVRKVLDLVQLLPELVGKRKVLTTTFLTTVFMVSRQSCRFFGGAGSETPSVFLLAFSFSRAATCSLVLTPFLLVILLGDPLGVASESVASSSSSSSSSSLLSSVKVPPRPSKSVASKPTNDSKATNCQALGDGKRKR